MDLGAPVGATPSAQDPATQQRTHADFAPEYVSSTEPTVEPTPVAPTATATTTTTTTTTTNNSPNAAPHHQAQAATMASTATQPSSRSSDTNAVSHGSATAPGAPSSAPVSSEQAQPSHTNNQLPTATIDPNVPSSESAPTALPTNPATDPEEQKRAIDKEHPAVIAREVEKTKAEERDLKGEKPKGTVVAGLEDDRLWAMLRRFDDQVTHVLHPATHLPPAEPDLRPSTLPNLPSHSDVLKSNLERVIAAVGPSSVRGAREMQRLMSWSPEERWRTGTFCAAYFTCWIFGYTMAGVLSFFVAIICFPECRRWFFPPVAPPPFTPPSATDPTNQKGDESLLGNVDSGTIHRSKHEQAEEQAFEATSILQAYTTRLIFDGRKKGKEAGNSAVGEKKRHSDTSSSDDDDDIKNRPTQDGAQGTEGATVVVGGEKITTDKPVSDKQKKKLAQREAKRKRDEMVSKMTKATEDGLGAFADTIERFTNALSPPSAYPDRGARFKIAGAFLVPPMFLLTFVPPWIFARSATFIFGVAFWGQPLLIRGAKKFVETVPNWQELLDMRNSILSGVPTDQQLTLHLLRVAEALHTPLPRPPPPPLAGTPKEAIKDTTPAAVTAEDDAELMEAEEEGGVTEAAVKSKHHVKTAFAHVFSKAGKKMAGFRGDVAIDGERKEPLPEKIGTKVDKLLFKGHAKDEGSIDSYPAKLDGKSGHIVLEGTNDNLVHPHIAFVPSSGTKEEFVLPIDDIVEIKKSHVSMPRIALGWASGAEIEGLGMTLRFKDVQQQIAELNGAPKQEGKTLEFTRISRREQLFVRLISMGRQRWESL